MPAKAIFEIFIFKMIYIFFNLFFQILAITDEANGGTTTPTYSKIQKQQHHYAQPLPYSRKFEGPSTPIASAFGMFYLVNLESEQKALKRFPIF